MGQLKRINFLLVLYVGSKTIVSFKLLSNISRLPVTNITPPRP